MHLGKVTALMHVLECSCLNTESGTVALVTLMCCLCGSKDGQFKVTSQTVDNPSSSKPGDCTLFWNME